MSGVAGAGAEARDLAGRADALAHQCETVAASTQDEAARGRLSRAADRLSASVTRPLRAVLEPGGSATEARPLESQDDLARALHELAADATRLRARLNGPPALLEATAALQDLSAQVVADDEELLAARRAEFGSLQAQIAPSIQSAPDGPYLITNVATVTDALGVELEPMPQAALCRCGASQIKPWCDGSHAIVGFSGEKAADRVPDRLDTYRGLGVTITDNRGTCAHSGFCTDRVPTAFRTDAEPFVAPAGGRLDELVKAARACPSGALGVSIDPSEEPGQADTERTRTIEVSTDGPYRVTGAVTLLDGVGRPEVRNAGASVEHYSLCRCGKSQNKPFCSGMHWYADFHDPARPDKATLFEWAGGFPAILRLTKRFYEKYVPEDPLLGPLFSQMSPDHPDRVAAWLGEVFGGPKVYTKRYGTYDRMISQHLGKGIQEEWRRHWVALLSRSADDVGLPADAEFRAASTAYLEWGSRIAVENSKPGVQPPPHMPVPRWWWVCDATPWSRAHAAAPGTEYESKVVLPGPDEVLSFDGNVRQLFRERDRDSMRFVFDLWSHEDVATHAEQILARLRAGTMPCDGAWSEDWVELFARWIAAGTPA